MKKNNHKHDEYEQLTISIDATAERCDVQTAGKDIEIGDKVIINPSVTKFCNGRGIPDYVRTAYVTRINTGNKTVVISTEPDGKGLGLLFLSDITLAQ